MAPLRRLFRLVTAPDPPLADFASAAALGRVFSDPELRRRSELVSVWDDIERVRRLGRKKPGLGRYVAVLEIPAEARLTGGRRGHWAVGGVSPEDLKSWVVEVVPL